MKPSKTTSQWARHSLQLSNDTWATYRSCRLRQSRVTFEPRWIFPLPQDRDDIHGLIRQPSPARRCLSGSLLLVSKSILSSMWQEPQRYKSQENQSALSFGATAQSLFLRTLISAQIGNHRYYYGPSTSADMSSEIWLQAVFRSRQSTKFPN